MRMMASSLFPHHWYSRLVAAQSPWSAVLRRRPQLRRQRPRQPMRSSACPTGSRCAGARAR